MIIGKILKIVFWYFIIQFILRLIKKSQVGQFNQYYKDSRKQTIPSIDAEYTILKD